MFEKVYGDSELAVRNTKTFARFSLGNILAEPFLSSHGFLYCAQPWHEEAEDVVGPRPNYLPYRTLGGRDSGVAA